MSKGDRTRKNRKKPPTNVETKVSIDVGFSKSKKQVLFAVVAQRGLDEKPLRVRMLFEPDEAAGLALTLAEAANKAMEAKEGEAREAESNESVIETPPEKNLILPPGVSP